MKALASYTIIPMKASHILALYALWQQPGLHVASFKRESREIKAVIQKNPNSCFVAKTDKHIIGSVLGTYNGRRGWIYHVAVNPHWQKKGLGSQLLQTAEKALIDAGATKILLGVGFANLKVVPFYEKHDYKVLSDAVLMEKDLFVKGGEYYE